MIGKLRQRIERLERAASRSEGRKRQETERERSVRVLLAALDDEKIADRPYAEVVDVLVDRIRSDR